MEMTGVASDIISKIGYDNINEIMLVEFKNGSIYQYNGVPDQVYYSFLNSNSKGKFFHSTIKNNYSGSKILIDR